MRITADDLREDFAFSIEQHLLPYLHGEALDEMMTHIRHEIDRQPVYALSATIDQDPHACAIKALQNYKLSQHVDGMFN